MMFLTVRGGSGPFLLPSGSEDLRRQQGRGVLAETTETTEETDAVTRKIFLRIELSRLLPDNRHYLLMTTTHPFALAAA
jgi:hypothetical protein